MEPYEEADLREDLLLDEEPEPPLEASLATVILLDEGGAQLLFDGEEEATSRRYRYLMSCANMQPNDRVLVQKVGGAYIVVGVLAPPVHEETVQYAETAGHAETADVADYAKEAGNALRAGQAQNAANANYASTAFQATQAATAQHSFDTDAVIDSTVSGRYVRFYASGNTLFITHSTYGTFRVDK